MLNYLNEDILNSNNTNMNRKREEILQKIYELLAFIIRKTNKDFSLFPRINDRRRLYHLGLVQQILEKKRHQGHTTDISRFISRIKIKFCRF
eukprot:UN26408